MGQASLGVAVPSFEQGRYVGEAIRSLRTLDVHFEAIVQDAGSSEQTLSEIRAAIDGDNRIRLAVEDDQGQSDAINRAWRTLLGRHPYVTWLNTDDVVYADGLRALLQHIDANPRISVAYGDIDAIDEQGAHVGWARFPDRVRRYRLVYHHNLVPGITPVIRSTALRDSGLLDTTLDYAMDHDLFIRLAEQGRLVRVPVTVAAYRTYTDAKTWGHKQQSEAEIAQVRARYRRLPTPVAAALRLFLRLAWWPVRHRFTRGVMRLGNRDFGVEGLRLGA